MRMKRAIAIGLGLLLGTCFVAIIGEAAATAKKGSKPVRPEKAARQKYRAALEQGRKLSKQGKEAEAIESFKAALAAVPDDSAALSELGLSAHHLKDYAQAETATRK